MGRLEFEGGWVVVVGDWVDGWWVAGHDWFFFEGRIMHLWVQEACREGTVRPWKMGTDVGETR